MKKIMIAGGTGLIGQALANSCLQRGWQVTILGRDQQKIKKCFNDTVKSLTWEEFTAEPEKILHDIDMIVNLCGASIGEKRWSVHRKQAIVDSRVIPTRTIAAACAKMGKHAPHLYNASAIGIYGLQENTSNELPDAVDETTPLPDPPTDFLSTVGQEWEQACVDAENAGASVTYLRFGVVLSRSGGALPKMAQPFHFGLGGKIGSGRQAFSWVSLDDVVSAIHFLFTWPEIVGAVNIVAMQCVSQSEFAHSLGQALGRPSFMPMPAFILRILFGQMANELLLSGQHVVPSRLTTLGYEFQHPDLDSALTSIYSKK